MAIININKKDDKSKASSLSLFNCASRKKNHNLVPFVGACIIYAYVMRPFNIVSNVKKTDRLLELKHDVHERLQNCTTDQLSRIRKHLPPDMCIKKKRAPWLQKCSFTQASKCIRATWLTDYYTDIYKTNHTIASEHFVGISVGCNKGLDALDTLRMGTSNAIFDKGAWLNAMHSDGIPVTESVCSHAGNKTEQFSVNPTHKRSGELHCIEPFPPNYMKLKNSAESLVIDQEGFIVINAAMSKEEGVLLFPMPNVSAGVERLSLGSCVGNIGEKQRKLCKEVDGFTLETYVKKNIPSESPIHILSIDVEGYDFDVMIGGKDSVLDRVQYLEFEYNFMGPWSKQKLSDAIRMLDEHAFTCYWAGDDVLYRISGCWQEYYNIHHWANVACVHHTQQELAKNMENTFLRTLTKNYTWTKSKV